jgi:putative ATP-dependent endonuclease of OLD family
MNLSEALTAIVGPNASGKTALLQSLCKMFGVTRAQRTIHRSDFHLPVDVAPDDRSTRNMIVDVIVALPELAAGSATSHTIAPAFGHMQITAPGAEPRCRLRLEAQWEDDGTPEGEVTQDLYWVNKLEDPLADADKHPVAALDRGLIQVYYTPASRDAEAHIKNTTGALAARLLQAIDWSDGTRDAIDSATSDLATAFGGEPAITAMSKALSSRWRELHDDKTDTDPSLALFSQRFEEVIRRVRVLFQKGPAAIERDLDVLSDGQKSLFYFALAAAVFDLERDAIAKKIAGFDADSLRVPALSIFAVEEPENHLSPYYLARIVKQVRSIASGNDAQAIVTSHSPAVLSRVEPQDVRYCRCEEKTRQTYVKHVQLPEGDEKAVKFVRGAMLAFPELYFARFVLLVEGDSERIVLPKLAQAEGLLLDPSFVAVAPLGGRHVQHFWRLLHGLDIPFATLLDLDLGRNGGAFGRIKTAIGHLLDREIPRASVLTTSEGKVMDEKTYSEMATWKAYEHLAGWAAYLRQSGVYFSEPLDLDMAMLKAYPAAYAAIVPAGGGPVGKPETATAAVLGEGGPGIDAYKTAYPGYDGMMAAYRYHFLTHSKPATHLRAFAYLDDNAIKANMPDMYRTLLAHINASLKRD